MKTYILLGAPGAGKGTVSEGLKTAADLRHVSTGDMLRAAVKAATPVGLEARSYMERGDLVPDDVIIRLVKEYLDAHGDAGYLFDGFPRTEHQAEMLDQVLSEMNASVNTVFLLEVPEEVLIDRLSGRRVCRSCGAVFHVRNIPPKVEGVCDRCGGELYQRADDNEETVKNRLEVYQNQTQSLIDYYESRSVLIRVPAAGGVDKTQQSILSVLQG